VIPLDDIRRAREAIAGVALRTPLVRPLLPEAPCEIHLKLECLQPIGSFKIRGAYNAVSQVPDDQLRQGVVTASAGNMAQGVAYAARVRGVPATVVVPEHAPQTKLDAVERLGGRVVRVPYEEWWQTIVDSRYEGVDGHFVHPVLDDPVMAGNGTIGLELLEDLPDLDAVVIPWGGGGLASGIASAVKQLKPDVRVCSAEPETGAPMSVSLPAGEMRSVEYAPSFVDGSGSKALLPKMWGLGRELLDGALVASLDETAGAVRLMAERARVVAEGAGALALACALAGRAGQGKVVCVVSGGNIDASRLAAILTGETP
jgi:threonine dehydratase